MKRRYSFDDVKSEFNKTDYILLSDESEYINCSKQTIRYLCPRHLDKGELKTSLAHIKEGKGCYYCGLERTIKSHMIDFNKDEDRALCERNDFEYIDTIRKNGKITIVFICRKHYELGIQYMTKYNMQRDIKGCQYCAGKNLPEWYVMEKISEVNPYIELLDPYTNLTTRMKCRCNKHNKITYKTAQNILYGQGCYECGIEKLSKQSYLSIDEYRKRVSEKNPNTIVLEYNGMENNAKFQCKKCNAIWWSNAAYAVNFVKQCPNCEHYYTGEFYIDNLLNQWNIPHVQQKRFSDCLDQRPLPFDFYILHKNACIEFDGQHHFMQRNGWSDFEIVQKHDEIKSKYCKKHNIPLLRIAYDEENIEYVLFDFLVQIGALEEIKAV